jgi:hypothetical protein
MEIRDGVRLLLAARPNGMHHSEQGEAYPQPMDNRACPRQLGIGGRRPSRGTRALGCATVAILTTREMKSWRSIPERSCEQDPLLGGGDVIARLFDCIWVDGDGVDAHADERFGILGMD